MELHREVAIYHLEIGRQITYGQGVSRATVHGRERARERRCGGSQCRGGTVCVRSGGGAGFVALRVPLVFVEHRRRLKTLGHEKAICYLTSGDILNANLPKAAICVLWLVKGDKSGSTDL